jgi:hypothetical protein
MLSAMMATLSQGIAANSMWVGQLPDNGVHAQVKYAAACEPYVNLAELSQVATCGNLNAAATGEGRGPGLVALSSASLNPACLAPGEP